MQQRPHINGALTTESTDKYQSLLARKVVDAQHRLACNGNNRPLQALTVTATQATGSQGTLQRPITARYNTAVQQLLGVTTEHGTQATNRTVATVRRLPRP
ncbi:hypothetical protein T10_10975 [Trichinella papuae]|uniref:Uncharacterized protein n=1 Tax=Trichinella papuae TaxID=268474 RepID=A0A0V1M2I8_9BILA|nr:hypothetical protein T10_10975 [Trichinella papuae]